MHNAFLIEQIHFNWLNIGLKCQNTFMSITVNEEFINLRSEMRKIRVAVMNVRAQLSGLGCTKLNS